MEQYGDFHTHSCFSFDGNDSVDAMCNAALQAGLSAIAITDHYDTDGIQDGYYPSYDAVGARAAVCAAKKKYQGKLDVIYGLELGQPYVYPNAARKLLDTCAFDYVIGSLHNLIGVPDFYYFNAETIPTKQIYDLFIRAIDETERYLLTFPEIDTIAHITYPLRYFRRAGREMDLSPAEERLRRFFRAVAESGKALEVNTSGLRQGIGMTLPEDLLITWYVQEGGKRVAIGSDAHTAVDVGKDVAETYAHLRKLGVSEIMCWKQGKKAFV